MQLSYRNNLACVARHVSFEIHETLRTATGLSTSELKHNTERARQEPGCNNQMLTQANCSADDRGAHDSPFS